MSDRPFDTPLVLSGPLRSPKQMLKAQEYGGHSSIHDDKMAEELGFSGAPIEGPTHFSQFVPLFTLREKLAVITEDSSWHTAQGDASPWGRPIIPLEMVCVLCQYTSRLAAWRVREPNVGLFADLEIGMLKGPLFVGQQYCLEREVVAMGQTRRTEGYWVKTEVRDCETNDVLAYTLLHQAIMKDSFPGYAEELAAR